VSTDADRSREQIEADLARTRAELEGTVNELTEMLDPRRQVENVKENLRAAVARAGEAARVMIDDATVQAKNFAEDVKGGDPKSVGYLGAGVAVALAALALAARRR
jgi:hypothetical protein